MVWVAASGSLTYLQVQAIRQAQAECEAAFEANSGAVILHNHFGFAPGEGVVMVTLSECSCCSTTGASKEPQG